MRLALGQVSLDQDISVQEFFVLIDGAQYQHDSLLSSALSRVEAASKLLELTGLQDGEL